MPLIPLTVIAPLSECSRVIKVQGQITGAMVQIFANDRLVAEGIATWSEQDFPLKAEERLNANESIAAIQIYDNETSPKSYQPVIVQSSQPIGPISFASPIFKCSRIIKTIGAVPGATIRIRVDESGTSRIRGQYTSVSGEGRVVISPSISLGERLIANQDACGIPGIDAFAPDVEQIPDFIRPPKIENPLTECDRTVTISNVVIGALVTLERTEGPTVSAFFDASSLYFVVDPPLKFGEILSVKQEMCHVSSDYSRETIHKRPSPEPPVLVGTLCAGTNSIQVDNLLPGSRVKFFSNGTLLGIAEAPFKSVTYSFSLNGGDIITAKQEICGHLSTDSNSLEVSRSPISSSIPVIREPLYACGGIVRINEATPGTRIDVCSVLRNNVSIGSTFVTKREVDVILNQLLLMNDEVFAKVTLCGGNTVRSTNVRVNSIDELPIPTVYPLIMKDDFDFLNHITVSNIVPGSFVDVYVKDIWKGTKLCSTEMDEIPIPDGLKLDDSVRVRQRICSKVSHFSETVTVRFAPPIANFVVDHLSGDAPLNVHFTNQSSGHIENYNWNFGDGTNDNSKNPTHTYNNPGRYTVTLTVSNNSGANSSTSIVEVREPIHNGTSVVILERRPPLSGPIAYVGAFPEIGSINGNLKEIHFSGALGVFALKFVKMGHTTGECDNPNAVVTLLPNGTLRDNDLRQIYGNSNPPLPVMFVACVSAQTAPEQVLITVNYTYS